MLTVLCNSTLLRMCLAMVCMETCRSNFKCFNVKFYVSAFVGDN